jgi:lysophospholipase L1-like esterase
MYCIDTASVFLRVDGTVMDDVFVDDGLHFNDKGNPTLAKVIESVIMEFEVAFVMCKTSDK